MLNSRFSKLLSLINTTDPTGFISFRRKCIYINNDDEVLTLDIYARADYLNVTRRTSEGIPATIKRQISVKTAIKLGLLL